MRRTKPIEERLFPRIDATGPCWLWTGAKSIGGYGVISQGPRDATGTRMVHRAVWELLVGEIPDGYELDHLCRVRACCNPDHLELVTRAENVARGSQRAGINRKDACIKGHPFTPENTTRNHRQRFCRACAIERNRQYRARKKASS